MKHIISAIDERFTNICALTSITRSVRSLTQISIWKASEWRSWLIFYCVPCLTGLLKTITKMDVIEAHKLLLSYVFLFNKYFGVTSIVC